MLLQNLKVVGVCFPLVRRGFYRKTIEATFPLVRRDFYRKTIEATFPLVRRTFYRKTIQGGLHRNWGITPRPTSRI